MTSLFGRLQKRLFLGEEKWIQIVPKEKSQPIPEKKKED